MLQGAGSRVPFFAIIPREHVRMTAKLALGAFRGFLSIEIKLGSFKRWDLHHMRHTGCDNFCGLDESCTEQFDD